MCCPVPIHTHTHTLSLAPGHTGSGGGGDHEHFPHPLSPTLGTMASSTDTTTISKKMANIEKMKNALKALKRVTINQELSLQSLRAKASQRRSELEARDVTIAKLQKQLTSLRNKIANQAAAGSNSNSNNANTANVVRRLQDGLMDEESKNVELTELLQATEAKVRALGHQLEQVTVASTVSTSSSVASSNNNNNPSPSSPLRMTPVFSHQNSLSKLAKTPSLGGTTTVSDSQSVTSGSTATEFDVIKLKRELAKKSNRIVQLEYELEETKDELYQVKQDLLRQRHSINNNKLPKATRKSRPIGYSSSSETATATGDNNSFFEADFGRTTTTTMTDPFGSSDPFANSAFVGNHNHNNNHSDKNLLTDETTTHQYSDPEDEVVDGLVDGGVGDDDIYSLSLDDTTGEYDEWDF